MGEFLFIGKCLKPNPDPPQKGEGGIAGFQFIKIQLVP
jgi:hypothetical protein